MWDLFCCSGEKHLLHTNLRCIQHSVDYHFWIYSPERTLVSWPKRFYTLPLPNVIVYVANVNRKAGWLRSGNAITSLWNTMIGDETKTEWMGEIEQATQSENKKKGQRQRIGGSKKQQVNSNIIDQFDRGQRSLLVMINIDQINHRGRFRGWCAQAGTTAVTSQSVTNTGSANRNTLSLFSAVTYISAQDTYIVIAGNNRLQTNQELPVCTERVQSWQFCISENLFQVTLAVPQRKGPYILRMTCISSAFVRKTCQLLLTKVIRDLFYPPKRCPVVWLGLF